MSKIVGIDPGMQGGLVLLDWGTPVSLIPMPTIQSMVNGQAIAELFECWKPDFVGLERSQAMPDQGVTSMFNYGVGYGTILGILQGMKIAHRTIRPQEWQKWAFSQVRVKREDPKGAALAVAMAVYPKAQLIPPRCRVPHKGIVDALLIAGYTDQL
jgi:crossover junction endodeoxyribonuclease RuvC